MEIIILLVLGLLVVLSMTLLYRLLRWCWQLPVRRNALLLTVLLSLSAFAIHHILFRNMHFIQSNVYPDLFLVKYPDKNEEIVQQAIQQKVIEELKLISTTDSLTGLRFYEYYKPVNWMIFGDAGTAYFINHEEDPDGFIVEEIQLYPQYLLASFELSEDQNSLGELTFYRNGVPFRTEQITLP